MKKVAKKKNIYRKIVNNHLIKSCHIFYGKYHIVNKDYFKILQELSPIYQELDKDFQDIDVIDLIFYERWLNG